MNRKFTTMMNPMISHTRYYRHHQNHIFVNIQKPQHEYAKHEVGQSR